MSKVKRQRTRLIDFVQNYTTLYQTDRIVKHTTQNECKAIEKMQGYTFKKEKASKEFF